MSPILSKLKLETATLHKTAENLNYKDQIIERHLTLKQYCELILRNYYFHHNIEQIVVEKGDQAILDELHYNTRRKVHLIHLDLNHLSLKPSKKVHFNISLNNSQQMLGAVYVAEGATLGGKMILDHLYGNSQIYPQVKEFSFYNCYGSEVGARWKQFRNYLESRADLEAAELVLGAKKAFEFFIEISRQIRFSKNEVKIINQH